MTSLTAMTPIAARWRRRAAWAVLIVGIAALQMAFSSRRSFPLVADKWMETPIDQAGAWMRANRRSHWLLTGFFAPISASLTSIIESFADMLEWLPWYGLLALVFAIPARVGNWRDGLLAAVVMAYAGAFGFWEDSLETLAIMSTAVLISVVLGVPLGMWGALRNRVEQAMRPVLDSMQTIPAFIYFLPLFMLFGIGDATAVLATVIYALPPVVRLTTLGIRQVPIQAVEASRMGGATTRQTLFKVQMPMALPVILTGLSQTIMMAFGIVVIATLVGAGGLGGPVFTTLNQRRTGRGIAAGLAIVAMAMVLDRLWRALASRDRTRWPRRRTTRIGTAIVVGVVVAGKMATSKGFPALTDWRLFDPIDQIVVWARDNLRWMSRPFNDFVVSRIYLPLRNGLAGQLAWPVPVFVSGWLGWRARGWRLGVFCAVSVTVIGLTGLWALSADTLVQVLMATVASLLVAIPLGIWLGRRPRAEKVMSPLLDAFQTVPSLVYIIPFVGYFGPGVVPGILATVVYAMVPGVRITALGIRQVSEESVEASRTFGATLRQTMWKVRLPLAAPTIMAAVNQVIMMVLAMVIITGLVGGGALGFETVRALTRSLFGLGFEVGLALVLMAMVLDRLTEAAAHRLQPPTRTS